MLDSRFVVATPNTVWSVDVCKLKTKVRKYGYKNLQLFVAFDPKIITYMEVTAMDIVKALTPHLVALSCMQRNKTQIDPFKLGL